MTAKSNIILRNTLARLYQREDDARRIASDAGLDTIRIQLGGTAINNWYNILREAENQEAIQDLTAVAYKEHPRNQTLAAAAQGKLDVVEPPEFKDGEWKGTRDSGKLEAKLTDEKTLLPINFLGQGLKVARSVVRVVRSVGGSGTGFLTENDLLITSHHVIPSKKVAETAVIEFNYQATVGGRVAKREVYNLAPGKGWATSELDGGNDWTAVRVDGSPHKKWGGLKLDLTEVKPDDRVVIIQHAGGGPKQIAFYHNVVTYVGQDRVQYLTDTDEGSSGSPVFNHQWQVVAIHQMGGVQLKAGPDNVVTGNQGIHVNIVINDLIQKKLLEV